MSDTRAERFTTVYVVTWDDGDGPALVADEFAGRRGLSVAAYVNPADAQDRCEDMSRSFDGVTYKVVPFALPRPRQDGDPVEPEPGQVWRERRRMYEKRTVRVVDVDHSFVYTTTLTTDDGTPPQRPRPNRVRRGLWHKSWVPA